MALWDENRTGRNCHGSDMMNQPSKAQLREQLALAADANMRQAEELLQAAEHVEALWTDKYVNPMASEAKYHSRVATACLLAGVMIGLLIGWVAWV